MAEDPFATLLTSLKALFNAATIRKGKYSFAEIQKLNDATKNYDPQDLASFIKLLQALKGALPYLEKWKVDFNTIRVSMNALAQNHHVNINWVIFLSHPKISPGFQFSAQNLNRELELVPWIAFKTGMRFAQLSPSQLTQFLLEHRRDNGFSQRLKTHLDSHPEFLSTLIMSSERNFIDIAKTRLCFFLTDTQIAEAIIEHTDKLIKPHINPLTMVEQFVHTLNAILSKGGRSVDGLLRNTEAKAILDTSHYFQVYQTEEYRNRNAPHPRKRNSETLNDENEPPKNRFKPNNR